MTAARLSSALLTLLVIVYFAFMLSACAVVEEYRPDGTLARRSVGLTPFVVSPSRDIPAVRIRALGAFYGAGHAVIGHADVTLISADRPCAAFMFIDSAREALRFAALAHDINRICEGN